MPFVPIPFVATTMDYHSMGVVEARVTLRRVISHDTVRQGSLSFSSCMQSDVRGFVVAAV